MNVSDAIRWGSEALGTAGVDSPGLDAEVLLAHALGTARAELYLRRAETLTPELAKRFRASVDRRSGGCPVAYITGVKEFWSIPIAVTPEVLIPRPDTETVVREALVIAKAGGARDILDICTGSGCIAAALARELPDARIVATDESEGAMDVASRNLDFARDRTRFAVGDLFEPIAREGLGPFEVITANPPYIDDEGMGALPRDIADHEPRGALAAGPDGLDFIERIINDAPDHLAPGGWLVMEVGAGQAPACVSLATAQDGYDTIRTARDLAGIERVVILRRSPL